MTRDIVSLLRKSDKRYAPYYGVYALDENGRAVSQVLVLHIETRTKNGKERVAGIQAVGTLPGYSRRGYSTALMKRAHELIGEAGIRISFLLTSGSLVAYQMYEKLGYSTIATFDRGVKEFTDLRYRKSSITLKPFKPKYAPALDRLFARHTEGSLGFIYRQPKYLALATKVYPSLTGRIKVGVARGRVVGYACVNSEGRSVNIEELVGADDAARKLMLKEIERKFKAKYVWLSALVDGEPSGFYEKEGFSIQGPGWGRVMATSIDGSLSGRDIADLYGVGDGRFILNSLDNF